MRHYGISNTELKWFISYLTDRFQYVTYNNKSSTLQKITTGVPQGSILGPLLFLLYVNDLPSITDFKIIQYADDISIVIPFKYTYDQNKLQVSSTKINDNLNIIYSWLAANKLSLNISKTKYSLFHYKQKKIITYPNIEINNNKLSLVKHYKFLGIFMDDTLTWDVHIHYISNKISKTVGLLSKLKSFFPKLILLNIYNSLILSNINYGITCWSFGQCTRIETLQKRAIRIINNSHPYKSHTLPICKHLNVLLFKDLCDLATLKFYYKLKNRLLPKYFLTDDFMKPYNPLRLNLRSVKPVVFPDFAREPVNYRPDYYISRKSKISSDRRLSIQLATLLNKKYFPKCVLDKVSTHSINGTSLYFKTYIINNYDPVCHELNCFVCD